VACCSFERVENWQHSKRGAGNNEWARISENRLENWKRTINCKWKLPNQLAVCRWVRLLYIMVGFCGTVRRAACEAVMWPDCWYHTNSGYLERCFAVNYAVKRVVLVLPLCCVAWFDKWSLNILGLRSGGTICTRRIPFVARTCFV